jgi:hypothetical protein
MDLKPTIGNTAGDMQALITALQAHGKPFRNPDPDGEHYAIVPEGHFIEVLPVEIAPKRPRANVKLRDTDSFIAYFNDHKAPRSRIYATLEPAQFIAVFDDFHTANLHGVAQQADWRGLHKVLEATFRECWMRIASETETTILLGTPE